MLYGLLVTLYVFVCILLVSIILIQKTKGSTGLGAIGGGSQQLFGGSGGQDVFQKATWILGAIFMFSSFALAIMKSRQSTTFRYTRDVPAAQTPAPVAPPPGIEQ